MAPKSIDFHEKLINLRPYKIGRFEPEKGEPLGATFSHDDAAVAVCGAKHSA